MIGFENQANFKRGVKENGEKRSNSRELTIKKRTQEKRQNGELGNEETEINKQNERAFWNLSG